jgi:hypothetical protein
VIYKTPKTTEERAKIATDCVDKLKITIPCLLDDMKNTVDKAYQGAPDRLCVVDINGKVAYYGARGPWGFKPRDAKKALDEILENRGCIPGTKPLPAPEKKPEEKPEEKAEKK